MSEKKNINGCKTVKTKHGHDIEICPLNENEVSVKEK